MLPDFDFETYSEAGYFYDPASRTWRSISNSPPHGLGAVGAAVYSEHPSTEVLSLAYDLKDDRGARLWLPGMLPPDDLFEHIARGGLIEAWNTFFEYSIWLNVCHRRMAWPSLPLEQLRCAMAKARRHSLPGKLANAAEAVNATAKKIGDGTRLINKFSKPRNPTKNNASLRLRPVDDLDDGVKFYEYNLGDIKAEAAVSAAVPDLTPDELELWLLDQKINARGVAIDTEAVGNCIEIVRQATERYTAELVTITGGYVKTVGEIKKLNEWLLMRNVITTSLDADAVEVLLAEPLLPPDTRRVLEIRATLGSSSVKKLFSIERMTCADGRIRDLFQYCGADRTGRWSGRGPQPQNLPKAGGGANRCSVCRRHSYAGATCAWCGTTDIKRVEWSAEVVVDALVVIAGRSLDAVELFFGDALATVSGCLRGLFVAAPGHELICADFSAIEAVVLAALAGEQWRLDVFRTHGKIYEASAAMITGIPFAEFIKYKNETGDHHPMRNRIGKFAELASGFQGSLNAWLKFGAGEHLSDDAILAAVRAWRTASPQIVKFWYGVQDAAHRAVSNPGAAFEYGPVAFQVAADVLYCRLPSGRLLSYHSPRLISDRTPYGTDVLKLTYMGWNTDYTKGPTAWLRLDTYGGKLTENIVQAVARDLLAHAMRNVEPAGYPIVLHVHDEIVAEVPAGTGSVVELETIMAALPPWAAGWPVKASGGWRGSRYRKD